jgi:hypothetical protein
MIVVKARINIGADGSLSGRVAGLPPGEHEAEISVMDALERPAEFDANALARLPVLDYNSPDEIIGYNDVGHLD